MLLKVKSFFFENKIIAISIFLFSFLITTSEILIRDYYGIAQLPNVIVPFFYNLLLGVILLTASSSIVALIYVIFIVTIFAIQYSNIGYFGYWISPMDIWLLFEKMTEVVQAGVSVISHSYVVLAMIFLVSSSTILMLVLRRILHNKYKSVSVIGLVVLLFYPVKMTIDKDVELGRLPKISHSVVKTSIYTMGYFVGHTFPEEVLGLSSVPSVKRDEPIKLRDPISDNIILLMGESLSSSFMSVYGFQKPTTPWLEQQKQQGKGFFSEGFSGGLFTDVSVPYFFNMIEKPNALQQISSGDTNIFRLAKEQGYETYFYSSQMSSGLALVSSLGTSWIDHYADAESITGDRNKAVDDSQLITWLKEVNTGSKKFIVLNPSGSHEPYILRSPQEMKVFGQDSIQNEYYNSVYYTDYLIRELQRETSLFPGSWTFILTSDHGQNITGRTAGKGSFDFVSNYLVPIYIDSNSEEVMHLTRSRLGSCNISFQVQLSSLVAEFIGYENEFTSCDQGFVSGKRRTGNSGYMQLTKETDGSGYNSKMIFH
ncbi:sulfatase-like hydrolase/transferase [Vibrio sp. 404]|uniref:Sulfatase-like hydrolase/transferase n=1 Tax=Vibrio marinisediminis TaxID=2758441 RepID=A0A7W2FNI6_9VIBR|nr:sulfatase-like hydrolase/transferase [Vibrio marinisediminis]MBA5761357.1 sulfatase-like hydrolase/transferase [Vibrio marinisediminis]